MTTISITATPSLDIVKVNNILSLHNTSKNAIINKFLLLIQNGNINVDDFLRSDTSVKSDYDLLTARISDLESSNLNLTERLNNLESKESNNPRGHDDNETIDNLKSTINDDKQRIDNLESIINDDKQRIDNLESTINDLKSLVSQLKPTAKQPTVKNDSEGGGDDTVKKSKVSYKVTPEVLECFAEAIANNITLKEMPDHLATKGFEHNGGKISDHIVKNKIYKEYEKSRNTII
jgi:hypothetical protein